MVSEDRDCLALQADLAGQYSIERELGRGGMGVVYLAREVLLDRQVAIKVLPPSLAARPELRERFLREARTSAKLSHPNIVPIFSVDEVGSFVYFVMAYVEGESLGHRIRTRGPLAAGECARIMREVAWALAYAHARGIVHRDVKPDNILLESGTGRALVTDFGIAHLASGSSLTEAGQVMGTAQYMSPEQAAGGDIDGRSDLYSLGIVSFLALSGRLPFDAPTVPAVLAMHLTQAPPPTASVAAATPRSLSAVVDRCLAKDPEDRFLTGEALADAIGIASDRPAEIPPPLRVWLTRADDLKPIYFVWSLIVVPNILFRPRLSGLLLLAMPLLMHAVLRLVQTRRALFSGYTIEDLRLALKTFVDREREERAYEHEHEPPLLARVVRVFTYVTFAGVAVLALLMRVAPHLLQGIPALYWLQMGCLITFAGGAIGLIYPGRRLGMRDRITELQVHFWNGRAGRWFADAAGFRLGRRKSPAFSPYRPTELILGLASDDLYDSLPGAVRRELADLPAIVRRLETDAQEMRKRVAMLDESAAAVEGDHARRASAALADYENGDGGFALDAQRREVAGELRRARDLASRRLSVSVAALESIRLDLLRLQAGSPGSDAITAVLDAARRLSDDIDVVVQARADASAPFDSPALVPAMIAQLPVAVRPPAAPSPGAGR